MKKKTCILIGIGLLVAGTFLWRVSYGAQEPLFEGRPLSLWLDHHVASSAANPPYGSPGWKKADEAILYFGTNGLPTLLEAIRVKERLPWMPKLMDWARGVGVPVKPYRHPISRHEEAEYAFKVLGSQAAPAVPELIRTYEQNISPSSARCAAMSLGHIGQEAKAALPALIRNFAQTNADVRFYAVSAVMNIGGDPGVVVPALTSVLKDPSLPVRWNALVGLSMFGGRARAAVPAILEILNDPGSSFDTNYTQQVVTTLWRISPEKVGRPMIVEDSTPMITNGLTSQALKVLFSGKRKTLIPPGRAVPTLGQYWNSDPRPRLTLYRGTIESEASDVFLGHFEVLGLPATDNLNVSTLCVIVNGQIVLCARDNQRDVFLEIRRVDGEDAK